LQRRSLCSAVCLILVGLGVVVTVGAAAPGDPLRLDTWDALQTGPLDLSGTWRPYPVTERHTFKHPPTIVVDNGRRALRLVTDGEPMRIGRAMSLDVKDKPRLVWEWKPLVLPEGGDVRDRRRNDQTARVMLTFEGLKILAYVWDTQAPVGTEARPDELEIFQRVLIVVRSGEQGVGKWSEQRRNVYEDYRRVFGEAPGKLKWLGLESHSNDTRTRSSALFGAIRFDAR
jgi:hypothetical protein